MTAASLISSSGYWDWDFSFSHGPLLSWGAGISLCMSSSACCCWPCPWDPVCWESQRNCSSVSCECQWMYLKNISLKITTDVTKLRWRCWMGGKQWVTMWMSHSGKRLWVNINHIWLLFSISHCLTSNAGFIQDNIPYVPIYCRNHEYLKDSVYYTYYY